MMLAGTATSSPAPAAASVSCPPSPSTKAAWTSTMPGQSMTRAVKPNVSSGMRNVTSHGSSSPSGSIRHALNKKSESHRTFAAISTKSAWVCHLRRSSLLRENTAAKNGWMFSRNDCRYASSASAPSAVSRSCSAVMARAIFSAQPNTASKNSPSSSSAPSFGVASTIAPMICGVDPICAMISREFRAAAAASRSAKDRVKRTTSGQLWLRYRSIMECSPHLRAVPKSNSCCSMHCLICCISAGGILFSRNGRNCAVAVRSSACHAAAACPSAMMMLFFVRCEKKENSETTNLLHNGRALEIRFEHFFFAACCSHFVCRPTFGFRLGLDDELSYWPFSRHSSPPCHARHSSKLQRQTKQGNQPSCERESYGRIHTEVRTRGSAKRCARKRCEYSYCTCMYVRKGRLALGD